MKLKYAMWGKRVVGIVGAFVAGVVIVFGGVIVGNTAISQLVGLAVAQTSTLWNNVKDAAVGDGISNGVLAESIYLFNGTNFDRARGDIANGLDVDVTRISGNIAVQPVQGTTLLNSNTISAPDTITTLTLTGVANTRIHIYKLRAVCAVGTASLNITDNGVIVYGAGTTLISNRAYEEAWPTGLTGTTGANMVITVGTCGAGNASVLDIQADQF